MRRCGRLEPCRQGGLFARHGTEPREGRGDGGERLLQIERGREAKTALGDILPTHAPSKVVNVLEKICVNLSTPTLDKMRQRPR